MPSTEASLPPAARADVCVHGRDESVARLPRIEEHVAMLRRNRT
jgi:hypothetical protein